MGLNEIPRLFERADRIVMVIDEKGIRPSLKLRLLTMDSKYDKNQFRQDQRLTLLFSPIGSTRKDCPFKVE